MGASDRATSSLAANSAALRAEIAAKASDRCCESPSEEMVAEAGVRGTLDDETDPQETPRWCPLRSLPLGLLGIGVLMARSKIRSSCVEFSRPMFCSYPVVPTADRGFFVTDVYLVWAR